MRNRTAFTLIELLVVIAIIAVLASMLLPALRNAKDTAKQVACLGQLRGLGVGMAIYASDYNGNLPQAGAGACEPWTGRMLTYWDNSFFGLGLLYGTRTISSPRDFYCPAQKSLTYAAYPNWPNNPPGGLVFAGYDYLPWWTSDVNWATKPLAKYQELHLPLLADIFTADLETSMPHGKSWNVAEPDGSTIKHQDTDKMNDGWSSINNIPMSTVIMSGGNGSFPYAEYLGRRLGR